MQCHVIAAVRKQEDLETALQSGVGIIFDLSPDILTLCDTVKAAHRAGKKLYIHLDLATGIGKDKSGVLYAAKAGVDGIISTRVNIIKMAREAGLFTVQRVFIVDSQSIDTTVESLKAAKPDMVEIMPGIIPKVIKRLVSKIDMPIIAGGLLESRTEIEEAAQSGATAVSTGAKALWSL